MFNNLPNIKYPKNLLDSQKEKAQQFAGLVLSIIAFSFLGLFAINPTLSTIAKLKKELSDTKFVDQALTQKIENLSILQKKYGNLQNDIPIVLNAIPNNPEISLLFAQIQSIAQNFHIQVDNLQNFQVELFTPTTSDQKYHSYLFSLSGSGSFDDVSKFITVLTHMERVVNIEVFSINKTAQNDLLRITLGAVAYFKP